MQQTSEKQETSSIECTFHEDMAQGNEGKQNDGEKSKFHLKFIKITNNKNVVEMQQITVLD